MNKGFANIIIIIIVVLIVAGAAGYFILTKEPASPKDNLQEQNTNQSNQPVQPIPISQIDTSSWKTYVSERDGYEIRFPKTYICPEGNSRICADQNSRVVYEHLRLYSDDIRSDDEWPPTLSFEIEGLKQKPAGQDFFEYINSQIGSPANQRPNIEITKIHNAVILNGHKMVKVESIQDHQSVDLYFFEKDSTKFIRIFMARLKPEEANKRLQEINAIISSLKFSN